MDRDGLTYLVMNDWRFMVPDKPPPKEVKNEVTFFDILKCAFLCWWEKSCYRSDIQEQCVCYKERFKIPLYWKGR